MWTGYYSSPRGVAQLIHPNSYSVWQRQTLMGMASPAYYSGTNLRSNQFARFSHAIDGDDFHHRETRKTMAHHLATRFCAATIEKYGTDEAALKTVLKNVHRLGLQDEFQEAVSNEARRHGVMVKDASEVIEREFGGNIVERVFKSAPRKEALDYLKTGRNTYSAKPWEYRAEGMYRSIADFVGVCKKYPVMSVGVIGSVAWLGHRYPFLGAVSGVAIMAWSSVYTAVNEMNARRIPRMNAEKAEHYRNSGENLSAFLITGLGLKGIHQGALNGLRQGGRAYGQTFGRLPKQTSVVPAELKAGLRGTLEAVRSELPHDRKMTPVEASLFVSGLFDNVLLPFNWLAEKLKHNKAN